MTKRNGLFLAQHLLLAAAATGALMGAGCAADPDAVPPVPVIFENVLDDMEDGDDAIYSRGFRVGFWYGFNDKTGGTQMPDPEMWVPAAGGAPMVGSVTNAFSARTWGSGFTKWGAGQGFDLNNKGDMANPNSPTFRDTYDARGFTGVTFKAKGNAQMRFAIATKDVITVEWKGTCVHVEVEGMMCDDTHGKKLNVGGDWRTFVIPFNQMTQEGFGQKFPLNLDRAMAIHFVVAENTNFDISVDDIAFYKE